MKAFRFDLAMWCGAFLLPSLAAWGQQSVPPAPVPSQLTQAKTIFLSNAGADSGLFPHPFSGDPDRAYNEFYADVVSWGRYQLVASPDQADLVFELQLMAPNGALERRQVEGRVGSAPDAAAGDLRQADPLCSVGVDGVDCAGESAEDARP